LYSYGGIGDGYVFYGGIGAGYEYDLSSIGDCCPGVHVGVDEGEAIDGVVGDGMVGWGGDDESIVDKGVVDEGLVFCVGD